MDAAAGPGAGPYNPDNSGLNSTPQVSPMAGAQAALLEEAKRQAAVAGAGGTTSTPEARPSTSAKNKKSTESDSKDAKTKLQEQLNELKDSNKKLLKENDEYLKIPGELFSNDDKKQMMTNLKLIETNTDNILDISKQIELTPEMSPRQQAGWWANEVRSRTPNLQGIYDEIKMREHQRPKMVGSLKAGSSDSSVEKLDVEVEFFKDYAQSVERLRKKLYDGYDKSLDVLYAKL